MYVSLFVVSFVSDDAMLMTMTGIRTDGFLLFFVLFGCAANVAGNGIPPQEFIRQPPDKTAVIGGHIILPCQVKNKRGMLQWTRDGFGLGVERNLTGFDRYHMSGYDEEGKKIIAMGAFIDDF